MVKITLKHGKIIEFESDTTSIGHSFLCYNKALSSISLPNVTCMGNSFLWWNRVLEKFHAPKLKEKDIGLYCLLWHKKRVKIMKGRAYV